MKAINILLCVSMMSVCDIVDNVAITPDRTASYTWYGSTQERVEVKAEDLPEKVKASVGHKTELAWTIQKAYLITNEDKTEFYELFVQKPDGETWMKVDKEGKVLN